MSRFRLAISCIVICGTTAASLSAQCVQPLVCDDAEVCTFDLCTDEECVHIPIEGPECPAIEVPCEDPGCPPDRDFDGLNNGADNCPDVANWQLQGACRSGLGYCRSNKDCRPGDTCSRNQEDLDGDGIGDVCDADRDGDGEPNDTDDCPDDPVKALAGDCGCGIEDRDSDGDGTADCIDRCPDDPAKIDTGNCGCGVSEDDDDGDTVENCFDFCPDDPTKVFPGPCGCGAPDTDGDFVDDCIDPCPLDNPDDRDGDGVCTSEDRCRGGDDSVDADGDNEPDACDECPQDGDKRLAGVCGCGVTDSDVNGDGVVDCLQSLEGTPMDPPSIDTDMCGIGAVSMLMVSLGLALVRGRSQMQLVHIYLLKTFQNNSGA